MAKLTCNCLNVILNISQNNVEVDAREVLGLEENDNLFSDDSLNDAFIGGTLILVKLAMAGIEVVSADKIMLYISVGNLISMQSYREWDRSVISGDFLR